MSLEQQKILQRLAAMQGMQARAETEAPPEDIDALYKEARSLIELVGSEPDSSPLDDLEEFWGLALAVFGEDWEDILDFVLDEAETAQSENRPYHHNGYMYWYVLERCYEFLKTEELKLHRDLFQECLSCLRATRTLQESVAQEQAEKAAFRRPGS